MRIYIYIFTLLLLNSCRWVETKEELKTKELKSMKAPEIKKEIFIHSDDFDSREDFYQWMVTLPQNLIDTNNVEYDELRDHIYAENQYAKAKFHDFTIQTDEFLDQINGLILNDNRSFNFKNEEYNYYFEYKEANNFPILYRFKEGEDDKKNIIIDFQKLAKENKYFAIGDIRISHNNEYIAYAVDSTGQNNYYINLLNISKKLTQQTKISNSDGQIAWGINNKSIYFVETGQEKGESSFRLYQYKFHENNNKKNLIFEDTENLQKLRIVKSKSKRFLFLYSEESRTTTTRFIDLMRGNNINLFRERENEIVYNLEHQNNNFIIRTNHNSSPNFKLYKTNLTQYKDPTSWEILVGHRDDIVIEKMDVFKNFIVLEEKVDGLKKFHILNSISGMGHYADFPEETYSAKLNFNGNYESDAFIYVYSSLSTPETVFSYNIESRRNSILKKSPYDDEFNQDEYKTERVWVTSYDGVKIPVSLIYNKNVKQNGTAPLLISCESSYGKTKEQNFDPKLISLLDKGFVYAIAHVRGGGYLGEKWHYSGRKNKKKNSVMDFISCTEYLMYKDYASRSKIFASGSYDNGLIICAAINYKPNLFKGVILNSPKVDLITSLNNTIENNPRELEEWGNPEDEEMYFYLKSYSPYDNIVKNHYPNILVFNGIFDKESKYWESLKWVAKMRDYNTSESKIMIYTDLKSKYSIRQGRQKGIEETALKYSFLTSLLN
jgi:oligopeptidase B